MSQTLCAPPLHSDHAIVATPSLDPRTSPETRELDQLSPPQDKAFQVEAKALAKHCWRDEPDDAILFWGLDETRSY